MNFLAIQDKRIVINGVVSWYRAPALEYENLYLARVYASPHLGELYDYLLFMPKTNPILLDGRVVMYTLPSKPNIGYSLYNAKGNFNPEVDSEIIMVAVCPILLIKREQGGVLMESCEVIGAYIDTPIHDTLIEEF